MAEMDRDWKPGFRINHNDTAGDRDVVEGFKLFAKEQFDDVYILALKNLLENKDVDWKYDALHQMIIALQQEVYELKEQLQQKEKKTEGPKTFGG